MQCSELHEYNVGGYGEIKNRKVYLYGMSAWREYNYKESEDGGHVLEQFDEPVNGSIILNFEVTA